MELICKPKQWAWICVPKTPQNEAVGLMQVHGHVVQTQELSGVDPKDGPMWTVSPRQACRIVRHCEFSDGRLGFPGTRLVTDTIPDRWLRPLEGLPLAELQELMQSVADAGAAA